mmetsp:Transcript_70622/g.147928  ORF Transcript_70622/g.147928 Transcript_70622/m.147928 type:complete len:302 (+) Transcript_70622:994-1899(+)
MSGITAAGDKSFSLVGPKLLFKIIWPRISRPRAITVEKMAPRNAKWTSNELLTSTSPDFRHIQVPKAATATDSTTPPPASNALSPGLSSTISSYATPFSFASLWAILFRASEKTNTAAKVRAQSNIARQDAIKSVTVEPVLAKAVAGDADSLASTFILEVACKVRNPIRKLPTKNRFVHRFASDNLACTSAEDSPWPSSSESSWEASRCLRCWVIAVVHGRNRLISGKAIFLSQVMRPIGRCFLSARSVCSNCPVSSCCSRSASSCSANKTLYSEERSGGRIRGSCQMSETSENSVGMLAW